LLNHLFLLDMKNKIIFLLLFNIIAISCDQDKSLEIASKSLTEGDLNLCENRICPEITINYLEAFGNDEVASRINKRLNDFIINSLTISEGSSQALQTIEEAASNFANSYFEDKSRFPDMAADYFAEVSISEIYNTPELICFEMRQYLYTGGAHGYGTTTFLNIDPETGNEVSIDNIVNDKKKFIAFAESKFRSQQNIDKDQSINEVGFWFEDDTFYLPETVGFTTDSLIFVYNQYDIASYADGPIELKIPLKDAKPFLSKP